MKKRRDNVIITSTELSDGKVQRGRGLCSPGGPCLIGGVTDLCEAGLSGCGSSSQIVVKSHRHPEVEGHGRLGHSQQLHGRDENRAGP